MSIYRHSCGGTTVSAQYREDHHERITPRLSEVRSWGRAGGRRFRARIQLCAPLSRRPRNSNSSGRNRPHPSAVTVPWAAGSSLAPAHLTTRSARAAPSTSKAIRITRSTRAPSVPRARPRGSLPSTISAPRSRFTAPPHATEWKEVEWEWAMEEIAKRVKESRDKSFTEKERQGPARQPHRSHGFVRFRRNGQRGVLGLSVHPPQPRPGVYRTPGASLTQRHCYGSGRVVRTRCNDESLERFGKQ